MSRIIASVHPFVMNQEIKVYNQQGECVKTVGVKINEIGETCFNLCEDFNINQVILVGDKIYSEKIKKNFNTKFNEFGIEIIIIS